MCKDFRLIFYCAIPDASRFVKILILRIPNLLENGTCYEMLISEVGTDIYAVAVFRIVCPRLL